MSDIWWAVFGLGILYAIPTYLTADICWDKAQEAAGRASGILWQAKNYGNATWVKQEEHAAEWASHARVCYWGMWAALIWPVWVPIWLAIKAVGHIHEGYVKIFRP